MSGARISNTRRRLARLCLAATVVGCIAISFQLFGIDNPDNVVEARERRRSSGGSGGSSETYTVLGFNDLGMHCMNPEFSEMCILPPFNTLRAQVIKRDSSPNILTGDLNVHYSIPGNTVSSNKTNFWQYTQQLFGVTLPNNVGLTGNGLTGQLESQRGGYWEATGIPVTPLDDNGVNNPFQLARIEVTNEKGNKLAETAAVVPVSWEINCTFCHNTVGISVATDILKAHDRLHGTTLELEKPVLCAKCHADPALGTEGVPGLSTFSHAMHGSHASRMTVQTVLDASARVQAALAQLDPQIAAPLLQENAAREAAGVATMTTNSCYACHPGAQTECQRDVHITHDITCVDCHGGMSAVADEDRVPWKSLPTCGECHKKMNSRFDYEEPGKLFKDSRGHGGIYCSSCHGPQHATGPAVTANDNAQAILWQGKAGTIDTCTVCHTRQPEERFFHSRDK
ncbi:MAG: hypothetical protein R3C02_01220 [Planctomycetaceae bacterium]